MYMWYFKAVAVKSRGQAKSYGQAAQNVDFFILA
jgi:hypothetical protein